MKSEAVLQVNSEAQNSDNHSDTSSQMSDEGYRSMGLTQDKNKKRSSVYSQNSGEDIEENGKSDQGKTKVRNVQFVFKCRKSKNLHWRRT